MKLMSTKEVRLKTASIQGHVFGKVKERPQGGMTVELELMADTEMLKTVDDVQAIILRHQQLVGPKFNLLVQLPGRWVNHPKSLDLVATTGRGLKVWSTFLLSTAEQVDTEQVLATIAAYAKKHKAAFYAS